MLFLKIFKCLSREEILIIFKGLSVAKNCLRPESAPLKKRKQFTSKKKKKRQTSFSFLCFSFETRKDVALVKFYHRKFYHLCVIFRWFSIQRFNVFLGNYRKYTLKRPRERQRQRESERKTERLRERQRDRDRQREMVQLKTMRRTLSHNATYSINDVFLLRIRVVSQFQTLIRSHNNSLNIQTLI